MADQNSVLYLGRRTWAQARGHRPVVVLYLVLFTGAQLASLADPWVIGKLLNTIQVGRGSSAVVDEAMRWLLLYLGLQVGFWVLHGPARYLERMISFHVATRFKTELFRFVTELPLRWHRDHHSGESIDKMNRATGALYGFTAGGFEVVYMVLRLVGCHVILFFFMPAAGLVALAATSLALLAITRFDSVLIRQYRERNELDNQVASALQDYVTNVGTVITLRVEDRAQHEVRRRIDRSFPLYRRSSITGEGKWFVVSMLVSLMIVLVLAWQAKLRLAPGQVILAGTFFTLFEYLRRIGDSFFNFAYKYGDVVRAATDVRSAESIQAAHRQHHGAGPSPTLPSDWQQIAVRDLHFRYQDASIVSRASGRRRHHLADIELDLVRGRSLALVGESGSGKSTILRVLRGLHTPERVRIECDGRSMGSDLHHLTSHTTLMPQEPEIFSDTIRFNVTFGVPASDHAVKEALRLARFEPVLHHLPHGVDTNLSEKGVNLSGGERQRLALARGIFFSRGSDIVLLDEPTSSVDVNNERLIYETLLPLYRDCCVVSAMHRLHLLDLFDEIYVFHQGKIVEQGCLQSLLRAGGALARMWEKGSSAAS